MALRVLLADESSTIKKVFQLALQDFAVDVRPVNVGVDVLSVAQNFKPDIIFADVLLQKRSGYEVASELKQNAALSAIPVVLMWSGFMELDEDKFQASHANAQLEKPFDVGALRKLVTDLVPRTQGQRLSQFLSFPKMPEMEETPPPAPPTTSAAKSSEEDFKQVPIPKMKGADKYRLNLNPEDLERDSVPVDFAATASEDKAPLDVEALLGDDTMDEPFTVHEPNKQPVTELHEAVDLGAPDMGDDVGEIVRATTHAPAGRSNGDISERTAVAGLPALSAAQLEKLIREQSAEVIESVVWKVVPDLAAQIIERELNRLLKERESQP
jgi:CheY-like chemotaxis protein